MILMKKTHSNEKKALKIYQYGNNMVDFYFKRNHIKFV